MNETRKFANKALSVFLKDYNFKKRGSVWVLQKKEFLILFDLQKSQWTDAYYVNVGIQLNNLDEKLPRAYRAEFNFRLIKINKKQDRDLFQLDTDVTLIQQIVTEQVIKVFCKFETLEELSKYISENVNLNTVSVQGKKILNIK